jgi:menaquinone-dependent protoporphyrinogen IX oxidase
MKKVLIISTSLRAGSNSEILAKEVAKGAKEKGHNVELVSLKNKKIAYCKGCLACQKLGKCAIKDDANKITEKIKKSDVIVWATPVYYYEMSGQMKTVIDRANSLYSSNYKFREVYLVTTSTEDSKDVADRVISGVQGWIDCFDNVKLKKTLSGGGAEGPNDAKNMPKLLKQAYELGKKI